MSTKDGKGPPSGAERTRLHRKRHLRKELLKNRERDDPQALRDAVLVLISMCVEGVA